jgi:hypothetical protein
MTAARRRLKRREMGVLKNSILVEYVVGRCSTEKSGPVTARPVGSCLHCYAQSQPLRMPSRCLGIAGIATCRALVFPPMAAISAVAAVELRDLTEPQGYHVEGEGA